jgi:hypothetical protein
MNFWSAISAAMTSPRISTQPDRGCFAARNVKKGGSVTLEKTVVWRSRISAVELKVNRWQYAFTIRFEDGTEKIIVGFASGMRQHAIEAGVRRSGPMIDKGYQEGM